MRRQYIAGAVDGHSAAVENRDRNRLDIRHRHVMGDLLPSTCSAAGSRLGSKQIATQLSYLQFPRPLPMRCPIAASLR